MKQNDHKSLLSSQVWNEFPTIDFRSLYILAICNNPCIQGRCARPNVCTCNQGYRGSTCAIRKLFKSCASMSRYIKY